MGNDNKKVCQMTSRIIINKKKLENYCPRKIQNVIASF